MLRAKNKFEASLEGVIGRGLEKNYSYYCIADKWSARCLYLKLNLSFGGKEVLGVLKKL